MGYSLVTIQFFLVAIPIASGDLSIKLLAFLGKIPPTRRNQLGECRKVNLAVRLAVATLLGAVTRPVVSQELFLFAHRPIVLFTVQNTLPFVSKEEIVGRESTERRLNGLGREPSVQALLKL